MVTIPRVELGGIALLATQAVDWRQRFASKDRVASRGLHYHASTKNWLMIAGGRSDSYNDQVRIRDSDIASRQVKIKRNKAMDTKGSVARA